MLMATRGSNDEQIVLTYPIAVIVVPNNTNQMLEPVCLCRHGVVDGQYDDPRSAKPTSTIRRNVRSLFEGDERNLDARLMDLSSHVRPKPWERRQRIVVPGINR